MKKITLVLICTLIAFIGYSQKKDIEVVSVKSEDAFILSAINNSNVQQEITLTVVQKNLKGYSIPITKLIPSKSNVELIILFFIKNKRSECSYSYTFKPSLTDEEKIIQEQKLKEKTVTKLNNLKEGIIVFSKDGCPRCHYTTRYLIDNNIDFRLVDVTNNKEQNKTMWEFVKLENPIIETLKMPVLIYNGEVLYNIENLKEFIPTLKM